MIDIIKTIYKKDPALKKGINILEVFSYQGLHAIVLHRIANFLYEIKIPLLPRFTSQISRFLTGIEIHPGAKIGKRFFIDHGMGIVIGETTVIGDNVMLYDNVILGAKGWWVNNKNEKRHPAIGNNVTLCSGCKIIGPVSIGDNCIIGAGAIITKNVSPNSMIIQESNLIEKTRPASQ